MSMLGAAIMLAQKRYAVHWLRPRSKAPLAEGWSTVPVAPVIDLRQTYRPGCNLGVRCGHWSQPLPDHGLVVVDVDIKKPGSTEQALAAVQALVGDVTCPIVLSGGGLGSRHLWFACPLDDLPPKAATTILQSEETWIPPGKDIPVAAWKIEVLSTGKNLVVPPSIHPSGQPYHWERPLLGDLPLLPESIHAAVEEALTTTVQTAVENGQVVHGTQSARGNRPGDDFNRRADWRTILEPHGWAQVRQRGDITDWRRPGKDEGVSATTNYANSGVLYVFSSNAAPFEADTAYSPFTAHTILNCGGNFSEAARALQQQGYGVQRLHGIRTIHVRSSRAPIRTVQAEGRQAWRA